jgi:CIC family chloride channel protein
MSEAAPKLRAPGDFTTDLRVLLLSGMAMLVGLAGVAAAWVLLNLIALCTNFAYGGRLSFAAQPINPAPLGYFAVAVPVIGCLIVGLMARYGSEKIRGHGIPEAMEAILIGQSRIQPKVAVLKPLSSAISIGTGGPFGAEGPIIMTGGAIGSLFAQCFHMSGAERKTLLVAGAAAGMTAVFGTPAAALLLAVELLLFEWKPRSFIPVLAACLAAAVARGWLLTAGPLFPHAGSLPLTPEMLLACGALGLACGLGSGVLTAMVYAAEDAFGKLPIHWMWWPMIGGLVVGLGGLIEPHALGVGYNNIQALLAGSMTARTVLLLVGVKAVIWAVALGSGTSGGVLAPLLIMGGAVGALAGLVLPGGQPGDWALLGMAAMMGGTMRAPLTATLFAIELTGGSGLLVPLLATCGASYAVTVLLLKRSILTEKIARRGHHVLREYHVDPFDLARVGDMMATPVDTLPETMTIGAMVAYFEAVVPRHKSYPVVDAAGRLVGMVSRADALAFTQATERHGETIGALVGSRDLVVGHMAEPVSFLVDRMVRGETGRVPVLRESDGVVVGLVARKDLLDLRARRRTEDDERRMFLGRTRTAIEAAAAPAHA